jgi:hypothetical protein
VGALSVNPWFWVVLVALFALGLPRRLWVQRSRARRQGVKRP